MEQIETPKNNKYVQTNAVKGEYIVCNAVNKLKKCSKRIGKETYEEYLDVIIFCG
jgi:hypothetical protein